jgi:hypothetical protein
MIMGSRRYGARFGTAVANVGDLNMDGYEGKQWSYIGWSPLQTPLPLLLFTLFRLHIAYVRLALVIFLLWRTYIQGKTYYGKPIP